MRLSLVLLSFVPGLVLAAVIVTPHYLHTATAQSPATTDKVENATIPQITIRDTINSTYTTSAKNEESEKAVIKAVKDRLIDLVHTVAVRNATITSTGTITNDHSKESITVNNNNTRILEVLVDQLKAVLNRTNSVSQVSNATLQIHTETNIMCVNKGTAHATCNIEMRIR